MARIPVERDRKGTPWWLWLLGLLLLIGVIWLIAEALDDEPDADDLAPVDTTEVEPFGAPDTTGTAMAGQEIPEVNSFVTFVQTEAPTGEMGLEHEYTSRGILLLSSALGAVADRSGVQDAQVDARRDTLEQRAERLQEDPESLQHANVTRDAFTAAADLMESLQQQAYAAQTAGVQQVRQAAEAIDPQTPLLDQRDRVHTFFQRASEALRGMTGTA